MGDAPHPGDQALRNISDTARWTAVQRARESERPDALFRDPLARRLAGERGEQISQSLGRDGRREWPFAIRTLAFDEFINEQLQAGTDMIVNLAAGLDARPYRMNLPAGLQWIEVDLPPLLAEKEQVLAGERPRCRLERVPLDLADVDARRKLFESLGRRAKRAMILSEGLLIYLAPEAVASLARDLAQPPSFQTWAIDICSPGLMQMLQKSMGRHLDAANAPFKFAPVEGPHFFEPCGWKPLQVRSMLKVAAQHRRVSWFLRLMAKLPASNGRQGQRPWGGLCLLQRI